MTREEIRRAVIEALTRVAPDIDAATIDPDEPFRRAYDVDSMDYLNFIIALHRTLGVSVPEQDYAHVATVNGAVDYLHARMRAVQPSG
jgi:acyl carrier protein